MRDGDGTLSWSLEQIVVCECHVGQWGWPHDAKAGPVMEALGSRQRRGLFLRQSCLKIEWPALRGNEFLVIRDVQTRTA